MLTEAWKQPPFATILKNNIFYTKASFSYDVNLKKRKFDTSSPFVRQKPSGFDQNYKRNQNETEPLSAPPC